MPALVKVRPLNVTKPDELATALLVASIEVVASASENMVGLMATVLATSRTRFFQASRISA